MPEQNQQQSDMLGLEANQNRENIDGPPAEEQEVPDAEDDRSWDEAKARAIGFAINNAENSIGGADKLRRTADDLLEINRISNGELDTTFSPDTVRIMERRGEEYREDLRNLIAIAEAPLEKLYNMNPDYFQSLPTVEFVKIAGELEKIETSLDIYTNDVEVLGKRVEAMDKAIDDKKEGFPWGEGIYSYASSPEVPLIARAEAFLGAGAADKTLDGKVSRKTLYEVTDLYIEVLSNGGHFRRESALVSQGIRLILFRHLSEINENGFDMTARQKMEAHRDAMQEVSDVIQKTAIEHLEERREELLKQFSSHSGDKNDSQVSEIDKI